MTLSLLFAAVIGFHHAFEADHVLAVGNIATKRKSVWQALRDGIFWGLGHSSMIFAVGCLIILSKTVVNIANFEFFEVLVGITLVGLGIYRLFQNRSKTSQTTHTHSHTHPHPHNSKLAYSIGLIHGLAGSGAVILLTMSELKGDVESLLYLIIFGIGSIVGMMVVAGVFHLPFSQKIQAPTRFQSLLLIASALICIGYGSWMIVRYFL